MNAPVIARWLGKGYAPYSVDGVYGVTFNGVLLDDDQLLGAILRRAVEVGMLPCVDFNGTSYAEHERWRIDYWDSRSEAVFSEYGPTPLAAAVAAVEAMVAEQPAGGA